MKHNHCLTQLVKGNKHYIANLLSVVSDALIDTYYFE